MGIVSSVYADDSLCPILTKENIKFFLEKGNYETDGKTLATDKGIKTITKEAIEEEKKFEPNAVLSDRYYKIIGTITIDDNQYSVFVGNILGKDRIEAKSRALDILLNAANPIPKGSSDRDGTCWYQRYDAPGGLSSMVPAYYPVKSSHENIFVFLDKAV